jgi:uncharacterized protein YecE (DUF72 family)
MAAHPGYSRTKLARWADRIAKLPAADTYIYFNNDALGAALRDAQALDELLRARKQRVAKLSGPLRAGA